MLLRLQDRQVVTALTLLLTTKDRTGQDIRVLLYGAKGIHVLQNVKALLPLYFVADNMK